MHRIIPAFVLLLCLAPLQGCPAVGLYGVYDDKRLVGTIQEDNALASGIKADLLRRKFSEGWGIAVHCYYGNVFLVGDAPEELRGEAEVIARRDPLVRTVRTHWFPPAWSEEADIVVAARVRKELIAAPGLGSTRVDVEVSAGRVVLLGVAGGEAEIRLAEDAARRAEGVTEVTSLMMLPPTGAQRP